MAITRTWIWLELASSFLVFALGVAILGLQTYALDVASGSGRHTFTSYIKWQRTPDNSRPYDTDFAIVTQAYGTSFGSAAGVQAAGGMALSMGALGMFGCLYASMQERSLLNPKFPPAMIFFAFAAFVTNLVVFAYATAKLNQSDPLPIPPGVYIPGPRTDGNATHGPPSIYTYGYGPIGSKQPMSLSWAPLHPFYTFEGWTCKARTLAWDTAQLDIGCTFSMAARWMTIPAFVAALLMLVVSCFGESPLAAFKSKQPEKVEK